MLDSSLEYQRITHELDSYFDGEFMQPEIIKTTYCVAIHDYGLSDIDFDLCDMDETIYIARLSADGYLDCTDWYVAESLREAADLLIQYYGE